MSEIAGQLGLFDTITEPAPADRATAVTQAPAALADRLVWAAHRNAPGRCCAHMKLQHHEDTVSEFVGCDFCDCPQYLEDIPAEATSATGHCTAGRHASCAYAPGGACHGGLIVAQCYLLLPPTGGWTGTTTAPTNRHLGIAVADVIEPARRIICGCTCHHTTDTEPATELEQKAPTHP